MNVELQVNNSVNPGARFLTWAPSPFRIRVTNPAGATTPTVKVQISAKPKAGGGTVVFRAAATGNFSSGISVDVPANGTSLSFFAAGKFGQPSSANGDVAIEARTGNTLVGTVPVMV